MLGIEQAHLDLGLSQEMLAQTVNANLYTTINASQTVGDKHDDDDEPTCETVEYKGHKVIVRKDYHNTWFVKQIDDKKWLPHLFTEDVHGCMEEATHYIDWLIENEGEAE